MDLQTGNIKKHFFQYLFPAVAGAVVVALYSFVDTIAVGQGVGPNGTAAIAVCVPFFNVVTFVSILCGIGGATMYGQARGEGNGEKSNACFTVSLITVIVITAAAMALLWTFRYPIYRLCGADDQILPYAMDYGNWVIIGLPAFVCASYLPCFLRNDGAPNLVLAATVTGAVINIFGDWFLVFPMKMGMTGAAYASVSGAVVQSVVLCIHFFTKKCTLRLVRPTHFLRGVRRVLSGGFGAGFQYIAVIVTSIIMNNQIMKYSGPAALAIYGVMITVVALFQNIYAGVGQAAQPLVSVNFGAGLLDRIRQTYRIAAVAALAFSVCFTAVGMAFPRQITMLFMDATPEVLEMAPSIMRIYYWALLVSGYSIFDIVYLQSIDKPVAAAVGALLRGILLNGSLILILPAVFGTAGIWWAVVIAEAVTALWLLLYTTMQNKKIFAR